MAKKQEPPSLSDELCAYEKPPRKRWIDGVPSDVRVELETVRQRMQSGACKKPFMRMARDIKSRLNLSIQPLAIAKWLGSSED